jgi:hypothetical protein
MTTVRDRMSIVTFGQKRRALLTRLRQEGRRRKRLNGGKIRVAGYAPSGGKGCWSRLIELPIVGFKMPPTCKHSPHSHGTAASHPNHLKDESPSWVPYYFELQVFKEKYYRGT